ncbi:MAG: type II toxin-antitoxin system Phd/YefM family antitoxin [Caldilineaceae bacterium]|nr:type II toxin-antitoxin system Phd/YefM family antitoxin [Caldilineaceae bacterium]
MMQRVQQIVQISHFRTEQDSILQLVDQAPVVLAQRRKPRAVLVNVDEWNAIADELFRLRVLAESRRIEGASDPQSWPVLDEAELAAKLQQHEAGLQNVAG